VPESIEDVVHRHQRGGGERVIDDRFIDFGCPRQRDFGLGCLANRMKMRVGAARTGRATFVA